jgi:hypothetical protein
LKSISIFLLTINIIAKGTIAGTTISNIASIVYTYNNITKRVNSNEESFLIDRIIDIKIDSQDLKSVEVNPLDKARVLTFEVSNLGNSEENIIINNNSDVNSDFFALNKKVFIDSNNTNSNIVSAY